MNRFPVHQPPPDRVVEDLMRAGVTRSTAMAMEGWKAREVLELLRESARLEHSLGAVAAARGTL